MLLALVDTFARHPRTTREVPLLLDERSMIPFLALQDSSRHIWSQNFSFILLFQQSEHSRVLSEQFLILTNNICKQTNRARVVCYFYLHGLMIYVLTGAKCKGIVLM